jgi:hypothetical protein
MFGILSVEGCFVFAGRTVASAFEEDRRLMLNTTAGEPVAS